MKTIKASLRINKNGRLHCTVHHTSKVALAPKNGCKICWVLFEHTAKILTIDLMQEVLEGVNRNEPH